MPSINYEIGIFHEGVCIETFRCDSANGTEIALEKYNKKYNVQRTETIIIHHLDIRDWQESSPENPTARLYSEDVPYPEVHEEIEEAREKPHEVITESEQRMDTTEPDEDLDIYEEGEAPDSETGEE